MSALSTGSISLRLYAHSELDAVGAVDEMRTQASLAIEHGFDGVMTSEHHGGFAGYVPNPLQMTGFLLDAMSSGWAAPCPLLALLRPAALIAEETAWLAARFPDRVGLGLAAGALADDFTVMDLDMAHLAERFENTLRRVAAALSGYAEPILAGDPAVERCAADPVPVVSAVASVTAARRAARLGAGILIDSLATPARARELVDAYRTAGGDKSCILIRRAWVGEVPRAEFERQVDVYRSYAADAAQTTWGVDELAAGDTAERLAESLRASGADALNVRIHVPGIAAPAVRDQIARLGAEVLPRLRRG
jgi:alkanesulfonate monooxygenase SsuD/methylene tetrahydromethanopterin reductase-like flavin-dependent oxidoreductase (luciferase family)